MTDKPPTTDPEQRRANTEASRRQSGLPPEREDGAEPAKERADAERDRKDD